MYSLFFTQRYSIATQKRRYKYSKWTFPNTCSHPSSGYHLLTVALEQATYWTVQHCSVKQTKAQWTHTTSAMCL